MENLKPGDRAAWLGPLMEGQPEQTADAVDVPAAQPAPAQPEGQPVQYAIPAGYQAVAVPAMDPAQYTAWLQALQAQQVVAQQMFVAQQLAGVAGASTAAGLCLVRTRHATCGRAVLWSEDTWVCT